MTKETNPKTAMALFAVALLITLGAAFWQYNAMGSAKERVASLQAKLEESKNLGQKLQDATAQLDQSKEQLNHLELSVSELAYVPTLLSEVESVGKQNGLEVTGVKPKEVKPDQPDKNKDKDKDDSKKAQKPYNEIEIEVTGRGSYDSVCAFIDALNRFPKIVSVRTVDLEPKKDIGGTQSSVSKLEATVKLRAYVFPLKDPAKDGKDKSKVASTPTTGGASS